jgi:deoxyuridine 5'-triphosphate nucleotidohydrolase
MVEPQAKALDDAFFSDVDSEEKAYLLGRIASDGAIGRDAVSLFLHRRDEAVLRKLRDIIGPSLLTRSKKGAAGRPLVGFTIRSRRIVDDVRRWLDVTPPELPSSALTWAFLRGIFDGAGSVTSCRPRKGSMPTSPRCAIQSRSARMLESIAERCGIPCDRGARTLEWTGNNALDFMAKLYDGATVYCPRKRDLYLDWTMSVPGLNGHAGRAGRFRWVRTIPGAPAPAKAHASDSGYDVTLVAKGASHGAMQMYRTGIKIQPGYGWYFDLVPRSSIWKTGYMLANSVGVIDRSYVGEILVPLVKIDPDAPELTLPARIVQIVPRPIVHVELELVESLDTTRRGEGSFGSTGTSPTS